jgi:hypothetical protein
MDRTVRDHITGLERRIRELNAQLMEKGSLEERNRIESEIRVAELALAYYRKALELEKQAS